jgi:hypothetical protein
MGKGGDCYPGGVLEVIKKTNSFYTFILVMSKIAINMDRIQK